MNTDLPRIDYANHPAYGQMFEPDPALGEAARQVLDPLVEEMVRVEEDRVRKFGYRYGYSGQVGEDLAARGISQLQLPDKLIDPIHKRASPIIEAMRQRIAETRAAGKPIRFKTVEQVLTMEGDGSLWKAVDRALRELEIYDTVTKFFAAGSARINTLAIFVNPPAQEWANRPFRDLDVDTPPTAGLHIDSNGKCYLKAILYLNEVGPEQGPFCIVPGSHLWSQGTQDRIIRRAFDRSPFLSRAADERRMFISLPQEMQAKAEFGNDILPDSPMARDLLASEVEATGQRGHLNLFYPEAIHRGGNVQTGERHALQITLTAQY